MFYLSKGKFEKKLKRVEARNRSHRRKVALDEAKEYRHKLPSMSKLILGMVAFLCAEIIVFCEAYIVITGDGSAIYALIGVPVALAPTVIAYYAKSAKENTVGGIIYESAMADFSESASG